MSDDADEQVVFYTNPKSRGRIVRWMLEEIGKPYETRILDYATTMKASDYLAINAMGKVPAIEHGGAVVTECAAIVAYLADAFPDAGLAPEHGSPARGAYYRWLFFVAGPLEAAATNQAMGFVTPPEREASMGYGTLDRTLATLEGALEAANGHLAGDRFTAADLYVAKSLGFFMGFGLVTPRPAFEAYVAKHCARPAALRAEEIDGPLS